jgi:hypothetical protein
LLSVLEPHVEHQTSFETEPMEVAWAAEARWFIKVMTIDGQDVTLHITPQLSPDGLIWCDADSPPIKITEPGLYTFSQHDFGHWLRLHTDIEGDQPNIKLTIYLAAKE